MTAACAPGAIAPPAGFCHDRDSFPDMNRYPEMGNGN